MRKILYPLPHLASKMPFPVHKEMPAFLRASYLILHQHGNVHKHVMELLDAALQPHDVLVPTLNLAEGLLGNLGVNDLQQVPDRQTVNHQSNRPAPAQPSESTDVPSPAELQVQPTWAHPCPLK